MRHLFQNWDGIRQRIRQARRVYLLFDYDGTLTPIVSRPALALCPAAVKKYLVQFGDTPGLFVAIISGRSLDDLYSRIDVPGITYVGNHGLEVRNSTGIHKRDLSLSCQKEIKEIAKSLKTALGNLPGILFEDKRAILAVHYRMVPKTHRGKIFQEMEIIAKEWGNQWRVARGKMVFEVQPRIDFHKGNAVRSLLKAVPATGLLPFYFGDDRTDEDAFQFLRGKGISVLVGLPETPSKADFFLNNPGEVEEFMRRFVKARPKVKNALSKIQEA